MTENDYIAEYVRERHPGILSIDYAAWRLDRAISEFGISMREAISRISAGELQRMMEEEQEDEESEDDA
jgi:hypothetical protein